MLFYFVFVYLTVTSQGPAQYFGVSQPYASYEECDAGRNLDSIEAAFETSQCFGMPK